MALSVLQGLVVVHIVDCKDVLQRTIVRRCSDIVQLFLYGVLGSSALL